MRPGSQAGVPTRLSKADRARTSLHSKISIPSVFFNCLLHLNPFGLEYFQQRKSIKRTESAQSPCSPFIRFRSASRKSIQHISSSPRNLYCWVRHTRLSPRSALLQSFFRAIRSIRFHFQFSSINWLFFGSLILGLWFVGSCRFFSSSQSIHARCVPFKRQASERVSVRRFSSFQKEKCEGQRRLSNRRSWRFELWKISWRLCEGLSIEALLCRKQRCVVGISEGPEKEFRKESVEGRIWNEFCQGREPYP